MQIRPKWGTKWTWGYMLAIPVTQEAEEGGSQVQGQHRQS
jgi:hypothetical protein